MKFTRVTPSLLIAILTLLALLLIYLALNAAFWNVVGECGSFCGSMMSGPFVNLFSR